MSSVDTSRPLVEVERLQRTYKVGPTQIPALRDVSFTVARGEFVAIVGHSGAGKSTLLNLIAGVDRLSEGMVRVEGQEIHRMSEGKRSRWRGTSLGIVFQFFALLPTMTLLNNVMLPMELAGKYSPSERRTRAAALLTHVGLGDHLHKLPSRVSGGQQQRAAIARAIANDPPLLLGDEPTGNLDSGSTEVVFELFSRLVDEGKTILMVTQDERLAARMPRQIELSEGRVIRDTASLHTPDRSILLED
jgi:ABC-type lipoprotein export system ATPase subunit